MIDKKKYKQAGTSLIEVILYIAISGFVLVDTTGIITQIVYNQTKVETIAREDETARSLMHVIAQTIQEANLLNEPDDINVAGSVLNVTSNTLSTINYSVSNGIVYQSINNGGDIAITSSDVYVKNLIFTVESEAGVAPSINIQIDIQKNNKNTTTLTHYETTAAERKL